MSRIIILVCVVVMLSVFDVYAQEAEPFAIPDSTAQIVTYDADFFSRYQPNTALDMVLQLPGFQLDNGTDNRGFAAAVGNILINDRRLSVKQDLPSATLSRIPASQVERIQLIRGQVAGIDLQGQSVVANIFLRKEDATAIRWNAYLEDNNLTPVKPAGSISISSSWAGIDYNAGLDLERNTSGYSGAEQEFDGAGTLTSQGIESSTEDGIAIKGISLNAAGKLGQTSTHLNTNFSLNDSNYLRPSSSTEEVSGIKSDVVIETDKKDHQFEMGMDAERNLQPDLAGKLILLLTNKNLHEYSSRTNSNSVSGQTLFRLADTKTLQQERIARLEFDFVGLSNHLIQANFEGAYNILDRNLLQTEDKGSGPKPVEVPGANSRVKELRGDFLLDDAWSLGQFELDYGMGMEVSSVTQTGDANQKRNFTFYKPQASLSYSPDKDVQTRLSLMREVSQLHLTDFVSATVFEDNDLALGNPNLRPEKTWVAELSHERRFDKISVIKVTAFYNWITDVLDLLPLTPDFEAPGNIGNGRRWGMEFEGTAPLEWLGLVGSRLDLKLRWQDSTVVDPVTGEGRILSGQAGQNAYRTLTTRNKNNHYFIGVYYRQDLEVARAAWGWSIAERARRPLYRVNELDIYNEDVAVDAFIETTRWFGLKIRLEALNITDDAQERDRTVFTGERDLSPVDYRLTNGRHIGHRIVLSVSGSF